MNKINVMHLRSSLQSADVLLGGENVILSICKYLDVNRYFPIIVSIEDLRARNTLPLVDEARKENIRTEILKLKNAFDFGGIFKLVKLMHIYEAQILHCHEYKSNLIGFLSTIFNRNVTLVTTVHGWTGGNTRLKIYEFLDKFIVKYFKKVVAVSDYQKSLLIKNGIKPSKITVIENSIDFGKFEKSFNAIELKKKLGLPHDSLIIGTVGRLSPEKGQKYLIDAFSRLEKIHSNIYLLIIGNGPSTPILKGQVKDLGLNNKIIFAGFRKDIPELTNMMDIFVLPSLTEGLPIAVLEAMASAKPIVASSVGGIPSLIKHGETGLLANPKDVDSLCSEVEKFIIDENLRKNIGRKSLESIRNRYSAQKMVKLYEQIYEDSLKS